MCWYSSIITSVQFRAEQLFDTGSDAVNAKWSLTGEHKENDSAVNSCRHTDLAWTKFINTPKLTLFV